MSFKGKITKSYTTFSENKPNSNPNKLVLECRSRGANFFRSINSPKQYQENKEIWKKGSYSQAWYYHGLSFEVVVSNLFSFVFRLSFGLASDMGRLKKRCWGWLHVVVATDVSLSSLFICLVALCQIEKIRQFSCIPPQSQCFKKQSSNNGAPSVVSKSSSKLISSGGRAKTYPFFLPVIALTNFALTSCWNILERYSEGIPSALVIVAVLAGNCVLCLTIYINACKA